MISIHIMICVLHQVEDEGVNQSLRWLAGRRVGTRRLSSIGVGIMSRRGRKK